MTDNTSNANELVVHVTFAAAAEPYNSKYPSTTTLGTVLKDALAAFKIVAEGTTRYYLVFNGIEQPDTQTLAALAATSHGNSLKLSLLTETVSG